MKKRHRNTHGERLHADSNVPARLTKLGRKALRKRRKAIESEDEERALEPLWLQEILCDSAILPHWTSNNDHSIYYANVEGTLLRRWDGCTQKRNLDLNEVATFANGGK